MSEIQQNRYDQLLRRVADLKGPGSKVGWAIGDLLPVLDVETIPAELLLLSGSRQCWGNLQLAAGGAANFSICQLQNPVDSGAIIRIQHIYARSDFDRLINIGPTQNTLNQAQGVEAFVDSRVFGQGTVAQIQGANNNLATGSTFLQFQVLADRGVHLQIPEGLAVLAPGGRIEVSVETANVQLFTSFVWIERPAQPSELNL